MAWVQGGSISPRLTQCIYVGDGSDFILIGGIVSGTRQTTVTRVNPLTGATSNLTAMFEAVSWPSHQAARIGDWLYFFGRNNGSDTRRFYRYNLDTGSSEELAAPRAGSTGGVATVAGLVYEMNGEGVKAYDPGADSWDDALGAPPGGGDTWSSEVTALVSNGSLIVAWAAGFGQKTLWAYDPSDGSFTESPAAPLPSISHFNEGLKLSFVDGVVHAIGWYDDGGDGALGGFTWDLDSVNVWALPGGVEFGFQEGGIAEVAGDGGPSVGAFNTASDFSSLDLWFFGEGPKDVDWDATATLSASGHLLMRGHVDWAATAETSIGGEVTKGPSSKLLLVATVEYPFVTVQHAYLPITVDIAGGPGSHTALPIFFTTGRAIAHTPLALTTSILPGEEVS